MKASDFDLGVLNNVQKDSVDLVSDHSGRDALALEMENLYLLNWKESAAIKRKIKGRKLTIHPGPRNAVVGYVRLLAATDPNFTIPRNVLDMAQVENADMLEKAALHMWKASGLVRNDPTHYDILRSAAIYGEIQAQVIDTADYLDKMNANGTDAEITRAKNIADLTPFTYDVFNPRKGYPIWDTFGLTNHYSKRKKRLGSLATEYGEDADEAFGTKYNPYDWEIEHSWWDMRYHIVWVEKFETPLIFHEHGLKEIPIVATLVEGSRLFDDPSDQRNPFLYSYYKSGLWNRANLALTVMYSNIFQLGANPLFIFKQASPDQKFHIDSSVPGGVMVLPPGSDWYPVSSMGVIDPALKVGYDISVGLEEESTIYKQSLGQPVGPNAAYAMVSLLSQSGRLPLVLSQKKAQWAIGDLVRMSFMKLKSSNRTFETESLGQSIKVKPDMIPDNLQVECELDIAQPQDALQNANVASILDEKGLASKVWIQENILGIGQTKDMNRDILSERSYMLHYENYVKTLLRQFDMQEEMDRLLMDNMSQMMSPQGEGSMVGGEGDGQVQQVLPQQQRREPVVQGMPQEMLGPPTQAAKEGSAQPPLPPMPPEKQ